VHIIISPPRSAIKPSGMNNCVTGGRNFIMIKVKLKVIPNSSRFKLDITRAYFKVYLQNPPEKGKANSELIKQLTKIFKIKIIILQGYNSKNKLVGFELTQKEFDRKINEIGSSEI